MNSKDLKKTKSNTLFGALKRDILTFRVDSSLFEESQIAQIDGCKEISIINSLSKNYETKYFINFSSEKSL